MSPVMRPLMGPPLGGAHLVPVAERSCEAVMLPMPSNWLLSLSSLNQEVIFCRGRGRVWWGRCSEAVTMRFRCSVVWYAAVRFGASWCMI